VLPGARVFESAHPYADNMNTYEEISFPGASAVEIIVDPASSTEGGCDYLRFYCDNSRQVFFGQEKYHGGRGGGGKLYPGVGPTASLIIPAASFVLHFHSDGSNTDWGYKVVAVPTTKPPNCEDPSAALRALGNLPLSCCLARLVLTASPSVPALRAPVQPLPSSRCPQPPGPACSRVRTRTRIT
jgi:hypothetical protein